MKKIIALIVIIAVLATSGAFAQDSLVSATKTTGFNVSASVYSGGVVAKHWKYLTSTSPAFTSAFSTGWFSGSFIGIHSDVITVTDSNLMYVKVVSYVDSLPGTYDTSNVVVVRRKAKITSIVPTSATTTMHFSVSGDPGNGSATMTCTTYTTSALGSCTSCTSLPLWLARSDSGSSVVTTAETVPGTPFSPYTQYWHMFVYTNSVGSDTLVVSAWTLSSPTVATVSFVGETHTSSTADITMATNFFGYSAPKGVIYWKVAGLPGWTDSLVYTGYSLMTGIQNHTYTLTGLFGGVNYVFGYKAWGYFGPVSYTDSFTTNPPPPVFNVATIASYFDSSLSQVVSHSLYANISISNYASYTVDFCQGTMSNVVDWTSHTYMYGSGVTHEYFTPTVSGIHWIHIYGYDDAGHYVDGGYQSIMVTLPSLPAPSISVSTSITDGHVGDMPTFTWSTTNATSVTINGSSVSVSGSYTFPVPLMGDTTMTLIACNGAGCDTAIWTFHVVDNPNGISNTVQKSLFNIYPNPATTEIIISCSNWNGQTINLLDVFGKNIMQVPLIGEKTKVNIGNLPSGNYILSSPAGNKKIIKQ